MKALSIKQPWAWLICSGYKDIENRDWKIGRNPRHGIYSSYDSHNFSINLPERIYVHAGKKPDNVIVSRDYHWQIVISPEIGTSKGFTFHFPASFDLDLIFLGAIIGEVDIIDCVTESKSPWFVGKYGFVLANPVVYDNPIPYKGQLGFFEVPPDSLK